jgi:hypothetical protein
VAMPVMAAAPTAPAPSLQERPAVGRTQPLAVASDLPDEHRPPSVEPGQDRLGRAPAATAPLPQYDSGASDLVLEDPAPPPPRRIRPFEIALIVLTCGLYGIVVLLRQRKSPMP